MKKKVIRIVHKPKVAFEVIAPKGKTIGEYLRPPVINLARPAIVRIPERGMFEVLHLSFPRMVLDEAVGSLAAGNAVVARLILTFLREFRMAIKFYDSI